MVQSRGVCQRRPPIPIGNAGRNTVYGPGMQTLDAGIVREFAALQRKRASKPAREFFNALNHTNLGTPNRFVNTAQLRQHHRSSNAQP